MQERKCKTCGQLFTPTGARQVYCEPCGKERRKAKQREYDAAYALRWFGGKKYD